MRGSSTSQTASDVQNPLPGLLHTPLGLALLELQGAINLPAPEEEETAPNSGAADAVSDQKETTTPIGRLVFPDYDPDRAADGNKTWMKRAYLYVGPHQRLTGEVQALAKPLAVIRPRRPVMPCSRTSALEGEEEEDVNMNDPSLNDDDGHSARHADENGCEELEIAEIIRYKLIFSSRPEPIAAGIKELD